jgi:hypothetical protein
MYIYTYKNLCSPIGHTAARGWFYTRLTKKGFPSPCLLLQRFSVPRTTANLFYSQLLDASTIRLTTKLRAEEDVCSKNTARIPRWGKKIYEFSSVVTKYVAWQCGSSDCIITSWCSLQHKKSVNVKCQQVMTQENNGDDNLDAWWIATQRGTLHDVVLFNCDTNAQIN